jgi:RNA polymerase sigma-70 factor (ECF subfamily)
MAKWPTMIRGLVEKYKVPICDCTYRMTGNFHHAEDLAQEAFTKAFSSLSMFEGRAKFSSWLYRIALNLCKDHLRHRALAEDIVDPDALGRAVLENSSARKPGESAVINEEHARLQCALKALPAEYREVFVLRHMHELSYREISEISGENVGALKVRVHRARSMIVGFLEGGKWTAKTNS